MSEAQLAKGVTLLTIQRPQFAVAVPAERRDSGNHTFVVSQQSGGPRTLGATFLTPPRRFSSPTVESELEKLRNELTVCKDADNTSKVRQQGQVMG